MADKEYQVFEASDHLVKDTDYVDTLKRTVLSAAMKEEEDMVSNILLAGQIGVHALARRLFRYGEQKYFRGLPTARLTGLQYPTEDIVAAIESDTGYTNVEVTQHLVTDAFTYYLYWAEVCLKAEFLDADTAGTPWDKSMSQVYLVDVGWIDNVWELVLYDDPTYGETYFVCMTQDLRPPETRAKAGPIIKYYENEFVEGDYMLYTWFTNDDGSGGTPPTEYWWYNMTTGTEHPELYSTVVTPVENKYYPVALLLENYRPFDEEDDDIYNQTKALLNRMYLDADEVYQTLKDADTKDAEKTDLIIHFAVDIHQPTPEEGEPVQGTMAYTWEFFNWVFEYVEGATTTAQMLTVEESGNQTGSFNMYAEWDFVQQIVLLEYTMTVGDCSKRLVGDDFYIKKQVTEENAIEFKIGNFRTNIAVFHLQSGEGWVRKDVPTSRAFIPINEYVLRQMRSTLQEECMQASLFGTVLLVQETEKQWYEETWFKAVAVVVIVAIIVFAPYLAVLASWVASAVGAFAASFLTIAFKFAVGFILSMAIQALDLGPFGVVLSIAISIYVSYGMSGAVDFGTFIKGTAGSWASSEVMWKAVSVVVQIGRAGYKYYTEQSLRALQEENQNLIEDFKEKQEALEHAHDMLDSDVLNPLDIIRNAVEQKAVDSPTAFYNRTLENDPGEGAFTAIDHFADIALTSPSVGAYNPLKEQLDSMSWRKF